MRIVFVSDAYIPVPCGVAVSVETLRISLEKMGHTVYTIAPRYSGWQDTTGKIARLPGIFHLSDAYRPVIWPTSSISRKKITSLKLDIVHSHFYYDNFNLPIRIAKAAGIPHVNTIYKVFPEHARINPPLLTSKESSFEKSLSRTLNYLNSCDQLIALSRTSKKYLQKYNATPNIDVVPVGIFPGDFSSFPPETIKEKLNIPIKRKVVLYVGDVSEDNNIKLLFRTFKKVWHAIEDVHLLVIGSGDRLFDMKHAIVKEEFSKFVTFTGHLPKKQVNKIFGACDVLAYPGRLDPQPLVILESLASGTPVVAVEGMGGQEFVTNNEDGLICKPTIEDFSEKIIDLLRRDNLRMQFSMRARTNSRTFRASNLTDDLVTSYRQTIERYKNKLL